MGQCVLDQRDLVRCQGKERMPRQNGPVCVRAKGSGQVSGQRECQDKMDQCVSEQSGLVKCQGKENVMVKWTSVSEQRGLVK